MNSQDERDIKVAGMTLAYMSGRIDNARDLLVSLMEYPMTADIIPATVIETASQTSVTFENISENLHNICWMLDKVVNREDLAPVILQLVVSLKSLRAAMTQLECTLDGVLVADLQALDRVFRALRDAAEHVVNVTEILDSIRTSKPGPHIFRPYITIQ